MGFIRARRERKRLDGGMVAGERRPRIIKYNKEIGQVSRGEMYAGVRTPFLLSSRAFRVKEH